MKVFRTLFAKTMSAEPVEAPPEGVEVVSQVHSRTVLTEHEIEIEGVTLRETYELTNQTATSGEHYKTITTHTRSIGDRFHQTQDVSMMGGAPETNVSTTLGEAERAEFEEDWNLLWKPSITQDQLAEVEQTALEFEGTPETLAQVQPTLEEDMEEAPPQPEDFQVEEPAPPAEGDEEPPPAPEAEAEEQMPVEGELDEEAPPPQEEEEGKR